MFLKLTLKKNFIRYKMLAHLKVIPGLYEAYDAPKNYMMLQQSQESYKISSTSCLISGNLRRNELT